jgi:ComEC/Rec2-related protein
MLSALLLADRAGLDRRLRDNYEYLGIAHFLALSGLHLGIISVAVMRVASFFGVGARTRYLLLLAVLAIYSALTAFPPSIIRALALFAAVIGCRMLSLRISLMRTLVTSGVVLAILDYTLLFDPGFQLSFTAVAGITALGLPAIKTAERYLPKGVLGRLFRLLLVPIAITCSIQLFSMPLVLHYFGRVSLFAPLVNIAIIIPVTVVLYMGLVYLFVPLPALRDLLAPAVNMITELLWRIPEYLARKPHPGICSADVFSPLYLGATLMLLVAASFRRGLRYALLCASCASFLLSFILSESPLEEGGADFSGLRFTAGGICEGIEGRNILVLSEQAALILGGRTDWYEARRLVRALWSCGVSRIDHLIVVDAAEASGTGIDHILKRIEVGDICSSPYMPPSLYRIGARKLSAGGLIELGGGCICITGPDYPLPRGTSLASDGARLRYRIVSRDSSATDSMRVFAYHLTSQSQ